MLTGLRRSLDGRPAPFGERLGDAHPKLLLALWVYATIDGVGSARALARLCEEHLAYQWFCGGVPMNYHTLADFRTAHVAVLENVPSSSC